MKNFSLEIIKEIFTYLGVNITTLQEANNYAQTHLLIIGESWDLQPHTPLHKLMHNNKESLFKGLKKLGMIDKIYPVQKEYDYALVMGSLEEDVSMRIEFLRELYNQNYIFKQIILLCGERQLLDIEKENLPENIISEAQMMQYLFALKFKDKKAILANTPTIEQTDGTLKRPNTDDTLHYFNTLKLSPGSCLVISNAPYILRQTKVAQLILTQAKFPVDGAGPARIDDYDIVLLMDEFARTLYVEMKKY
ncbi:MAG: hypothetical protein P4L22_06335 [Candidatus Babeliales bacterium]|nr:hypothetical protein [Candidatus Babeliales bacterium]